MAVEGVGLALARPAGNVMPEKKIEKLGLTSREFTFDADQAADLLSALSNAHRLTVVEKLQVKEWDVGALAIDVGLSQSALSQHLRKLRDLRLVDTRRSAQNIYYSSSSDKVKKILATLKRYSTGEN